MDSLSRRIREAAESSQNDIVFLQGDEPDPVPWSQLHTESQAMAATLVAHGVRAGDHVAFIGPTSRTLVTTLQATWLAGATIVVLPLPMRLSSIDVFVDQTRARLRASHARLVILDRMLAEIWEPIPGDPPVLFADDLAIAASSTSAEEFRPPREDPDRLAVLQYTSGSTSAPKGVSVPERCIVANLDDVRARTEFDAATDRLVSWLPLYHDMGLVGILTLTMYSGGGMVLAAPQDFLARPANWMEWISEFQGTATAGPNFAYALATRALRTSPEVLDLSRLRVALNGAEPVDPAAMRAFTDAGARHQMRPGVVFPAFGMAETTIAGSFPRPLQGLRVDVVDGQVLENERYAAPASPDQANARELVLLGRPMDGLEFRVTDFETGRRLGERDVGELEIRGNSVSPGYFEDPHATAEAFRGDWFRTGDLAYLVGGELVLCGRIKDVIIIGGRNVYPQDIERAVGAVEGIRTGNVIAFGVDGRRGKQSIVVVAEHRSDDVERTGSAAGAAVRTAVGLPVRDVVLVSPGSLPKTSSGKLQRSLCKKYYLAGELTSPASVR